VPTYKNIFKPMTLITFKPFYVDKVRYGDGLVNNKW